MTQVEEGYRNLTEDSCTRIINKLKTLKKEYQPRELDEVILPNVAQWLYDVYVDKDRYMKNYDSKIDTLVSEMEGAILYCISKHLNKKAACILTVVDSMYEKIELSSHDREQALDQMITVALDTVIE